MKKVIIIPAFNPGAALLDLIFQLETHSSDIAIIVVNDGSATEHLPVFQKLNPQRVTLLTHPSNQGKGQALKTAIQYALQAHSDLEKLVTADADGQHDWQDILKILDAPTPDTLVLGVRQFSSDDIPWRSRIGNLISGWIFFLSTGLQLRDTQTGLRRFSPDLAKRFLTLTSSRYEYEMDMLIYCKRNQVPLVQIDIQTIYLAGNKSSHFNPVLDSLRISFTLLRFFISAVVTAAIDITIFSIAYYWSAHILLSMVAGRVFASSFNFVINRNQVFKDKEHPGLPLVKYSALVVVLLGVSYVLLNLFVKYLSIPVLYSKLIADGIIFFSSFLVQRLLIFKNQQP